MSARSFAVLSLIDRGPEEFLEDDRTYQPTHAVLNHMFIPIEQVRDTAGLPPDEALMLKEEEAHQRSLEPEYGEVCIGLDDVARPPVNQVFFELSPHLADLVEIFERRFSRQASRYKTRRRTCRSYANQRTNGYSLA